MKTLVVICVLFASSSALSEHDNGHNDHDENEPVFSPHFIRGAGGLEVINIFGNELEDGDKASDEDESSVNAVMESFKPGIQPLNNAFGPPPPPPPPPGRRR